MLVLLVEQKILVTLLSIWSETAYLWIRAPLKQSTERFVQSYYIQVPSLPRTVFDTPNAWGFQEVSQQNKMGGLRYCSF